MNSLITPPTAVGLDHKLIVVDGQTAGTTRWIDQVINDLRRSLSDEIIIASPQAFDPLNFPMTQGLQQYWLEQYSDAATKQGAAMFWMPKVSIYYPDKATSGMSALMRFQELYRRHREFGLQLALGIDPANPHADSLKYRMETHCPDTPVFDCLEDTLDYARVLMR